MQIAGVSITQLAQVDNSSNPARLAFAIDTHRDKLEQVTQQLIKSIDQPAESRQTDSRVGQNIDVFA